MKLGKGAKAKFYKNKGDIYVLQPNFLIYYDPKKPLVLGLCERDLPCT